MAPAKNGTYVGLMSTRQIHLSVLHRCRLHVVRSGALGDNLNVTAAAKILRIVAQDAAPPTTVTMTRQQAPQLVDR